MKKGKDQSPISNLFHDCGYIYLSDTEPEINEPVTLRLRTERNNVTYAFIELSYDCISWTSYKMEYETVDKTGLFEYFIGSLPGQEKPFKYRFRVGNGATDSEVWYSRTYIGKSPEAYDLTDKRRPDNYWTIIPGLHTPDWAKGILWYSVMPDAFYNGDLTSDRPISGDGYSNAWNVVQNTLQYRYGGDLAGISKKLDYIKELGCQAVFMNPIFKTNHGAGYSSEFFKQIEPTLGNRQAFEKLARECHNKGLYYMIDVVLTFVDKQSNWFNLDNRFPLPGAAQDWNSPYHDFFFFDGEKGDTKSFKSVWGGVKLNHASERLCDALYRNDNSYLKYYCSAPFNADAVRFDCGGNLSGVKPDGTVIEDTEVMGKMRPYLRKINPEMMLLTEYSPYCIMDSGVWDSRWNLNFSMYALAYMKGEYSETQLYHRLDTEIHNLARTIALCQYNSISDHDRPRIRGVEPYAYRAYQLIHMTEIGAPCIYYGDEIKNERETRTFYSMEWNESNWNYSVLNDTKALIQLHNSFSTLKNGIVKYICADDEKHILSFARIDDDGTIITVASRNAAERRFSFSTAELSETDGTVFTDWFTGRQYVSRSGYLDVLLPPGGTVFVKGTASSDYKGGLRIEYSRMPYARVTAPSERSVAIGGTDAFIGTEVFNACKISARTDRGTILLKTDSDSLSALVSATVNNGTVTVLSRQSYDTEIHTAAVKKIPEGSYIFISRDEMNQVEITATKTPGGHLCERICSIHADLPNHIKAGFTDASGSALFEDIQISYSKQPVLFDKFTKSPSAMFDFYSGMPLEYTASGLKAGDTELLTNACGEDWTFKTKLKLTVSGESSYAGIVCRQDSDICVTAGRIIQNGKTYFFISRTTGGKQVIYHTVPDTAPDKPAIVQLQKIGTAYTAVFTRTGKRWHMIGRDIIANLCAERVGLTVSGGRAIFSYACFGDAVNDGKSFNTPHTPIPVYTGFSRMENILTEPVYRIVSGDWSYADEGYRQSDNGTAQMGIAGKTYNDFTLEGTYLFENGKGFIGIEFAKKSFDSPLGDGILLRIDSDRSLHLTEGGKELASSIIPESAGSEIRLCVENRHGVFAVFAGINGEPLLVINDFQSTSGSIAYFTEGVCAHLNNTAAYSCDSDFYFAGMYERFKYNTRSVEKRHTDKHGFINPFAVGVTDFIASAAFTVKKFSSPQADPYAGFYICSPESKFYKDKALAVIFNQNNIYLRNGKQVLKSAPLTPGLKTRRIMVIKKSGIISVYCDKAAEPVIEYTDSTGNGGAISLCANMASVVFRDFSLRDLAPSEVPEQSSVYRTFIKRNI